MVDAEAQLERVRGCGYTVCDYFALPEAAWWDDYYLPMQARTEHLRARWQDNSVGLGVLDACEREIDYYRRFADFYGYLFVIVRC